MCKNIQEKFSKMSDFFNQKLSKNTKKMHILGAKVQNFSGGGPPDPPLIGRLRLLFRRLAKIPAENPDLILIKFFSQREGEWRERKMKERERERNERERRRRGRERGDRERKERERERGREGEREREKTERGERGGEREREREINASDR